MKRHAKKIKISEKISDVKTLAYDLLNQDKLDKKLSIKSVELDRSEIIVKGSKETLDKVAKVKALVDLEAAKLTEKGYIKKENQKGRTLRLLKGTDNKEIVKNEIFTERE